MAWRRLGDKPLSEPMMVSLPMHICVTRPQWVNLCLDHESPCVKVLITPYIPDLFLIKKNTHEPFIPTHSNILPYHVLSRMVTFDPLCADTLGWHREAPSYDYVIRKPVNHPCRDMPAGCLKNQLTHSNSCISWTNQHIYKSLTEMESWDLNHSEK